MYLTKKHLSRRTLLQGVGVSVGLPLLDAMIPAATALAQTAAAPNLRGRIQSIDRWGVSSKLLPDYARLLELLAEGYPAARVASLKGDNAALDRARAQADDLFEQVEAWLAYAEEAEDE